MAWRIVADLVCDGCGAVLSVPGTNGMTQAEVLRLLELKASWLHWRMEGAPWLTAGDFCPGCWSREFGMDGNY